jgi:hypothetical protein
VEIMQASETVHAENHQFIDAPIYRVNFWEQASPPRGWMLDAFVLCDVEDLTGIRCTLQLSARLEGTLSNEFVGRSLSGKGNGAGAISGCPRIARIPMLLYSRLRDTPADARSAECDR